MTKFKISNRLKKIANFVDDNSNVLDIGCDHALLDIYLINEKKANKCIASDLRESALKMAQNNLNKYNINNIELRCGSGLKVLDDKDNIDTVIISGLGYITILDILNDNKEKLNNIETLIIQSNNHLYDIRKNIIKLGYYINDEVLVFDKNIMYTIIKFKKGIKKYNKKQLYFGPVILNNKNKLFYQKIITEINKNNEIIKKINNKKFILKIKLKIKNMLLKKEIK